MNIRCLSLVLPIIGAAMLSMCHSHRYGSVNEESAQEALSSPKLAITPHSPGWLLNPTQIYHLSAEQMAQVRSILTPEKLRQVPESYYQDETEGNRHDDSTQLFYLYASSGQCLGGRIIGRTVMMDDYSLSEQETTALYTLLRPQLVKIFPKLSS